LRPMIDFYVIFHFFPVPVTLALLMCLYIIHVEN